MFIYKFIYSFNHLFGYLFLFSKILIYFSINSFIHVYFWLFIYLIFQSCLIELSRPLTVLGRVWSVQVAAFSKAIWVKHVGCLFQSIKVKLGGAFSKALGLCLFQSTWAESFWAVPFPKHLWNAFSKAPHRLSMKSCTASGRLAYTSFTDRFPCWECLEVIP